MCHLLRPALLALLFSQLANESSNSLSAALFPWLAAKQGLAPQETLLGLAILCAFMIALCAGLKRLAERQNLLRLWWPTCMLSAGLMAALAAYPGQVSWTFAVAALVLICAEPIIEVGTSVLVPEQAARMGWQQTRLNGLLLFVGALSTALAPLSLPFLARHLSPTALLDLVLVLGVAGVLCLAPLRAGLNKNSLVSEQALSNAKPQNNQLVGALRTLPLALCVIVAFEAALLPSIIEHREDALSLQAWFVTCVALGAAIGGITTTVVGEFASNVILKSMTAITAVTSIASFCMMPSTPFATAMLLIGALTTGIWLGLVMPAVEAKLQAQGATPIERIAPMIEFARAMALRCMFGFFTLALTFFLYDAMN
jgi:MFS family permease